MTCDAILGAGPGRTGSLRRFAADKDAKAPTFRIG